MDQAAATTHRRGRAAWWWLAQALSGVVLVGFVGLHLVAQHFLAPGGLRDFESVVEYLRQPLVVVAELGLVLALVVHAGLGVRTHVIELVQDRRVASLAMASIAGVAAAIVIYALWLTSRLVG